MVTIIIDRTGFNLIRMYIDGVDQQVNYIPRPGSSSNPAYFQIGAVGGSQCFMGDIDEVATYINFVLTEDEVWELYMNGSCTGKWNMEGNGDDSSGNFNNGTLCGNPLPEGVAGVHNLGLSFNGANYMDIPNHATLNYGTGPFSISFWVNTTSAKAHNTIIDKRTRNGSSYTGYLVELYYGRPLLQLADTTGWYNYYPTAGPYYNNGQWYFFTILVDRPQQRVYFYVNGQQTSSFDSPQIQGSITNASNLYIGKHIENASSYFVGILDEVKMYKRKLSAAEISEQYYCH